jgi:hypothetical protein
MVTTNGWWEAIKAVPGAVKAIAQLVGDVGEFGSSIIKIGTAKANQQRELIEIATKEMLSLREAVARAVNQTEWKNSKLIQRAMNNEIGRIVREQENREAVVVRAIEDLRDRPHSGNHQDVPTDDWLNRFAQYAQQASSEKLPTALGLYLIWRNPQTRHIFLSDPSPGLCLG